jgi:hypothetical protein
MKTIEKKTAGVEIRLCSSADRDRRLRSECSLGTPDADSHIFSSLDNLEERHIFL